MRLNRRIAEAVGITPQNLSVLKSGRREGDPATPPLDAICRILEVAGPARSSPMRQRRRKRTQTMY